MLTAKKNVFIAHGQQSDARYAHRGDRSANGQGRSPLQPGQEARESILGDRGDKVP